MVGRMLLNHGFHYINDDRGNEHKPDQIAQGHGRRSDRRPVTFDRVCSRVPRRENRVRQSHSHYDRDGNYDKGAHGGPSGYAPNRTSKATQFP